MGETSSGWKQGDIGDLQSMRRFYRAGSLSAWAPGGAAWVQGWARAGHSSDGPYSASESLLLHWHGEMIIAST